MNSIIVKNSVVRNIHALRNNMVGKNREIGALVCGNIHEDHVTFSRSTTLMSNKFSLNSFWFNEREFPSIQKRRCDPNQEIVALIHTHPNGSSEPSQVDKNTSENLGLIGCSIGAFDMTCYIGDKVIERINI